MKNTKRFWGSLVLGFVYGIAGALPAMAADTEIYFASNTGGAGGDPNVLLLIDTSGSMLFPMYTKYPGTNTTVETATCVDAIKQNLGGCAKLPEDRRGSHLRRAIKKILEALPGNIRVGIARYNDDSNGGRIIYPAKALDEPAGSGGEASMTDTGQVRVYGVEYGKNDVNQLGTAGAGLIAGANSLVLGNYPEITETYYINADSNESVQYNNSNVYIGDSNFSSSTTSQKNTQRGLYLHSYPTSTGNKANLGLRFTNLNIPKGTTIKSARLVLTHAGNSTSAPTSWSSFTPAKPWGSAAITGMTVGIQNSTSTNAFSTSSSNRVNDRTYVTSPVVTLSINANQFVTDGEELPIDVTGLVQNRVNAVTTTLSDVVIRVAAGSTNAGATALRRIYGYHDLPNGTAAGSRLPDNYAPRLEVSYQFNGSGQMMAGVRFEKLDIPQGAHINKAYLKFTADANASGAARYEISLDKNLDAAEFDDSANHLATARWSTASPAPVVVTPGNWVKDTAYELDVTSLIQARVDTATYCGATGAVAFLVKDALTFGQSNPRTAYTMDSSDDMSPMLVVDYELPANTTCMALTRRPTVGQGSDDAVQSGSSQVLNDTSVFLRSGSTVGLRFPGVDIPRGATIRKAWLDLNGANNASGTLGAVTIKGAIQADTNTFSTNNKVGDLPTTASPSVSWSLGAWKSGVTYSSADIKTIVQKIVNESGWVRKNAMAFTLAGSASSSSSSAPKLNTIEGGESTKPMLVIEYETNDPASAVRTVRQDLIDTANKLAFGGGTPLNETYYETALYMLGRTAEYGRAYSPVVSGYKLQPDAKMAMDTSNLYLTPVDGGMCQSNNIVMLTDGDPSNDGDKKSFGSTCTPTSATNSWNCMEQTAKYLKETGLGGKPINTYTISFGDDVANADTKMGAVASKGGGSYFPAKDADTLASAFQTIFGRISDSNASMATPGVAVNQLNRSEHLDQVYYGVFKPALTQRWMGNLKRYRLQVSSSGESTVMDADGRPAIDPASKFFSSQARSWWSLATDGNEAAKGGAANKLASPRKVYFGNGNLLVDGSGQVGAGAAAYNAEDMKWLAGIDVDDADSNGNTTEIRKDMGAPLHSQPVLIPYGNDYVAFFSTNDGLLHSINTADGTENWAWVPTELLGNAAGLRQNSVSMAPLYGLDGNWTAWINGSTKYLVGGMGDGGKNYYAVNVSNKAAPTLQWSIIGGTGSFSRMGNTWAQPVSARLRVNGAIRNVFLLGGGYDPAYEASTYLTAGTDIGNAVYIVDADDGSLIWSASASSGATISVPDMKYSIPGRLTTIDKDADGLVDHIYFNDLGGQIFRIDVNNRSDASSPVTRVRLLAKLGASENNDIANARRFFEPPAVAYVTEMVAGNEQIFAAVTAGSGYRSRPLNKAIQDRFYMIKDYDAARFDLTDTTKVTEAGVGKNGAADLAAVMTTASLADVTNTLTDAGVKTLLAGKSGWYISMGSSGEKVLSASFIFQKQVFFNTYTPDRGDAASNCAPVAGSTSAWRVSLEGGLPVVDHNGDGQLDRSARDVAPGIVGDTLLVIAPGGEGVTGVITGGSGGEPPPRLPDDFNRILKTKWYEVR